ncbi:uncharacterized protein EI90DRAFT_3017766 [Cantharellus anzutake]|uniref:uncharacterized protein n=1 Tax=Cantharellus anzutake TaxID=1750568 RepID=UPI001904391A|nr:uncharacterized protein EI90DRAFT_3017766 [Cantharellus anzutake]KAF8328084.1 hypothetical protein EI90DRAFT_3017766 [Cantharellus anzutake]
MLTQTSDTQSAPYRMARKTKTSQKQQSRLNSLDPPQGSREEQSEDVERPSSPDTTIQHQTQSRRRPPPLPIPQHTSEHNHISEDASNHFHPTIPDSVSAQTLNGLDFLLAALESQNTTHPGPVQQPVISRAQPITAGTPETVYDNSYSIEKIQGATAPKAAQPSARASRVARNKAPTKTKQVETDSATAEAWPLPGLITYKVNVGGKAKPQLLSLDLEYEDWKSAISATPGLPENKRFRPEITWKLGTAPKMQDPQTVDDNQEYQLMVHEIVTQHEKDGKQPEVVITIRNLPEKDRRKTGQKSTKKKQGSRKARKKRSKTGRDDSSSSDSETDSGSTDSTTDESDSDHSRRAWRKKPAKLVLWQIEDLLHEKHHFLESTFPSQRQLPSDGLEQL